MGLSITVQDERGKVPINRLSKDQARRLFQQAGLTGQRLDQVTDSFLDWEDGGQRAGGAGSPDYAARGVEPRQGPVHTIGELGEIRGVDAAIVAKIAASLSLFPGDTGGFDPKTSVPIAADVMADNASDTLDAIAVERRQAQQQAQLDPTVSDYVGRPVTVQIVASDGRSGVLRKSAVIELTGQTRHPYWIRAID